MTTLNDLQDLLANGTDDDGTPAQATPTPPRRPGRPRKNPVAPTTTAAPSTKPQPKPKAPEPVMPAPGQLAKGVANLYVFAGMGLGSFRPQTGMALAGAAEEAGKAWEELAKTNPAVRRALMALLTTSTWGALIGVHVPIVMVAMAENKTLQEKRSSEQLVEDVPRPREAAKDAPKPPSPTLRIPDQTHVGA